jgi:hypothetical protein
MLALAYRDLPDIDAVRPLDEADLACLTAIRDVLAQHGRLDRFGVNLLHNHFPIHEDEVLVETCDDEARSLTMTIQPKAVLDKPGVVQTAWRMSDGAVMMGCHNACVVNGIGRHPRKHVITS